MAGTELKAIETVYNGYRFRSRLEARWAVFFDNLGIAYQYEAEGFDLGPDGFYLPDFYLPRYEMFIEVKPPQSLSPDSQTKAVALVNKSNKKVLILLDCLPDSQPVLFYPEELGKNVLHPERAWGLSSVTLMACTNCNAFGCFLNHWGYVLQFDDTHCGGALNNSWKHLAPASINSVTAYQLTEAQLNHDLQKAFKVAQQARFEHGEKPGLPIKSKAVNKPSLAKSSVNNEIGYNGRYPVGKQGSCQAATEPDGIICLAPATVDNRGKFEFCSRHMPNELSGNYYNGINLLDQ